VRQWRKIVAGGLLLGVLGACSSGPDDGPAPTSATSAAPSAAAPTPSPTPTVDDRWCEEGEVDDELEVTFGEISAASDEWSAAMGRTWRHYIPVTLTNVSDKPCVFHVKLDAAMEGGSTGNEQFTVPLQPGQSYRAQAFDLEVFGEFAEDSESATPAAPITPSVFIALAEPWMAYYETVLEDARVEGEGAQTELVAEVTMVGRNARMPDRDLKPYQGDTDRLFLLGLNSAGDVIAKVEHEAIEPIPDGETQTFTAPLGGGSSADAENRNQNPVSVLGDVVSWEIGMLQPTVTEIAKDYSF
jgi:hypothetical protein